MDAVTRADMQAWTGCIAGALTRTQFEQVLSDAGLVDVEIRETHRVPRARVVSDRAGAQTRTAQRSQPANSSSASGLT